MRVPFDLIFAPTDDEAIVEIKQNVRMAGMDFLAGMRFSKDAIWNGVFKVLGKPDLEVTTDGNTWVLRAIY